MRLGDALKPVLVEAIVSHLPVEALDVRVLDSACRGCAPARRGGGRIWWANLELTRINIGPTIPAEKIEEILNVTVGADLLAFAYLRVPGDLCRRESLEIAQRLRVLGALVGAPNRCEQASQRRRE